MKLKAILAASALALGAQAGHAATNDWEVHDALEVGMNMVYGSFVDYWKFTIEPTEHTVSSTAVANNLGGGSVLHISDGMYSLWSMGGDSTIGGGDDTQLGGDWSFDGTSGDVTHSVLLSPGSYYYKVTGTGDGSFTGGGLYSLTSTLAPVPEAETWAMMLAGLGVLGFLGARRRRED